MRGLGLAICLSVMSFGKMAYGAESCNADGYTETIIEEAKVETVSFTAVEVFPNMSNEKVYMPAQYKVMDVAEFEQLSSEMSYEEWICHDAVIEANPRDLPIGRISDFDFVRRPDGAEYMRPLEPSIHAVNDRQKEYFIAKESWVERPKRVRTRPDPAVLPNGQLHVMMSPLIQVSRCIPAITKTVRQRYVISRTPAIIQLSQCDAPQQSVGE